MEKENKDDLTTIAIFRKSHKLLVEMCKKGENFRDVFHKIVLEKAKAVKK